MVNIIRVFKYAYPAFSRNKVEKLRILWPTMRITLRIFILGQRVALRIKNWHELKETLSETVTVSDNWFVFNVDSVYCTVCLCISDRVCSLLHVYFVVIMPPPP